MSQALIEFLRDKKERADHESAGIDWASVRTDWITAVGELYRFIVADFLRGAEGQGILSLSSRPKQITEPHLGTYTVDELTLTVGDERVVFSPKGRHVVGAQGRVDVRGEEGEAALVVQNGGGWNVVLARLPQLLLVPLDDEAFGELLRAVMRK